MFLAKLIFFFFNFIFKIFYFRLSGKPVKPPNSAYSLYSRVMLQSDPQVKKLPPKERMAEISKKWKELSDAQKARYEEKVREVNLFV